MFTKPWFRCGLAVGASFLAVGAVAASAGNDYVEVSSSTPGVVEVVPVGMDFHITTANVSDAFKANAVNPAPGWNLISPNPASFEMTVGGSKGYEVRSQSNEEDKAGGNIFLFKVDVEIDGVGEDKEETEGAFVGYADCANGFDPACVAAMKPVRIRCMPAKRPDGERIVLTFPPGHLLEKIGTTYQAAQSSYKANEIGGKSFWLHGHAASGAVRDKAIKAEHNINGCKDEAKYTVVKVDLDIWNGGSDLDNGQTAGSQGAQVPEDSEVSIGAYLLVNWDDDDADGTMNADGTWSALPLPDLTENSVANEDNLAKLKPTVEPLLDIGTIELEVSGPDADKVKLWAQSTKGTEVTLTSNKKTWNLANSTEKADFQTFMNDGYWIEGTDVGTAERGVTFTVRYKDGDGNEICKDDNKATVVMINLANVVARDNMIDLWGIGQNSRGHSALVWRYAGTCTLDDLTNDVNFILIEMQGPTDNRNLTTITQQAGYPAYGCFRNPSMTYVQRLRIMRAACALVASAPITYTATDALQPHDWDGALNTITGLRCDSLVEVCYEINGVGAWGMERDADSHMIHYMINDQADNWSYSTAWGTWTPGANNLPDNLEEHNDFDLIGWADTFMPATQCGNVAPDEAATRLARQNLCQPIGSTGGN